MNEATRQLARKWLGKAESDLLTAGLLIEEEQRLLDVAVYHCQQSAEKALKAWLTLQATLFPKTHDLEALLQLCQGSRPEFAGFSQHAALLTPLAHEFRYPGLAEEPTPERAEQALGLAREVYTTCQRLLQEYL